MLSQSSLLTTPVDQAVYYTSVNCNPLSPLLLFVVDLLYSLFLQLTLRIRPEFCHLTNPVSSGVLYMFMSLIRHCHAEHHDILARINSQCNSDTVL